MTGALARRKGLETRALIRNAAIPHDGDGGYYVTVRGNVADPAVLAALLRPGCCVANFVYDAAAPMQESLAAANALAEGCIKHGVRRMLHCSTATVVGVTRVARIDETTACHPGTAYEKTKIAVENLLLEKARGRFELVILRPTAVFGAGGRNLLKLARDLAHGPRLTNYLRSCANGARRLNLVAAENVVAAAVFLLEADAVDQEIFIISDDENPLNNFRDVESCLMHRLAIPAYPARCALPQAVLSLLLRMRGRSLTNPETLFSCDKLRQLGFIKPVNFDAALAAFASWYAATLKPPGRLS